MRRVIANTTPLIALANIDRLELLRELYGSIIIPQAVMDEIIREPAKQRVRRATWIKVEPVINELLRDGLFISDTVKSYVLKEAGE